MAHSSVQLQIPVLDRKRSNTEQLELTVSTEFMHNHSPSSPFDPQQKMLAVEDHTGEPMLFSIGEDHALYVAFSDRTDKGRWKLYNLSAGLPAADRATTFEVMKDSAGRLILALVMTDPAFRSTLYLTAPFSSDPTLVAWPDFYKRWIARPLESPHTIRRLVTGHGEVQDQPFGLAVMHNRDQAEHYFFNTDATDTSWLWKKLPIPQNATRIVDLAVGRVHGDDGVYVLCETAAGQCLEFTSLPDRTYHKSSHYDFPLPERIDHIAATPGDGTSSDLYAAGAGLYVYPGSKVGVPTTLAKKADFPKVDAIVAAQGEGRRTAVYAVAKDMGLYVTESAPDHRGAWSPMTLLEGGVSQIAGFQGAQRRGQELFLVRNETHLMHLFRSDSSASWQERPVDLPRSDKYLEYPTYTTTIRVSGSQGRPMPNFPLDMTASTLARVSVNGISHSLDTDRPVRLETDVRGTLTLIQRVADLASPTYHLRSDHFAKVVDIQPTQHVVNKLRLSAQKDDWTKLKLASTGERIIKDDKDAKAAQQAVAELAKLTVEPASSMKRGLDDSAHIARLRESKDPVSYRLCCDDLCGQQVRVTFGTGGAAFVVDRKRGLASPVEGLEVAFGDAIRWMGKAIHDVSEFVVHVAEDVATFVVKIGGEIIRFVVSTYEQIAHAVSWLFEKIKAGLEKLVEWLGFLFNWDDIKRTHRHMVAWTNQLMDHGISYLHGKEGEVTAFFEKAKRDIHSHLEALRKLPEAKKPSGTADQAAKDADPGRYEERGGALDSPNLSWGTHHLQYSSGSGESLSEAMAVPEAFDAYVREVFAPVLESAEKIFEPLMKDLEGLDLASTSLLDLLDIVGTDLLIALLDIAEKLVVGLLKLVEAFLGFLKKLGNTPQEVPLFSGLYKDIVGEELTPLNLVCLVAAIPVTILSKLMTGKMPLLDLDPKVTGARFGELLRSEGKVPHSRKRGLAAEEPEKEKEKEKEKAGEVPEVPEPAKVENWNRDYAHVGGIFFGVMTLVIECLNAVHAGIDCMAILQEDNEEKAESYENSAGWVGFIKSYLLLCRMATFYPVPGQYNERTKDLTFGVWGTYAAATAIEISAAVAHKLCKVKIPRAVFAVGGGIVGLLETNIVMAMEGRLNVIENEDMAKEVPEAKEKVREVYHEVTGKEAGESPDYAALLEDIRKGVKAFSQRKVDVYMEDLRKKDLGELRKLLHPEFVEEREKYYSPDQYPWLYYNEDKLREVLATAFAKGEPATRWAAIEAVMETYEEVTRKSKDLPMSLLQNIFHCIGANLGSLAEVGAPFGKAHPGVKVAVLAAAAFSGMFAIPVCLFQMIRIGDNYLAGAFHRVY